MDYLIKSVLELPIYFFIAYLLLLVFTQQEAIIIGLIIFGCVNAIKTLMIRE